MTARSTRAAEDPLPMLRAISMEQARVASTCGHHWQCLDTQHLLTGNPTRAGGEVVKEDAKNLELRGHPCLTRTWGVPVAPALRQLSCSLPLQLHNIEVHSLMTLWLQACCQKFQYALGMPRGEGAARCHRSEVHQRRSQRMLLESREVDEVAFSE